MASEGRGDYLLGNSLLQAAEETKDEEEEEERRRKSPGPTLIELQRLLLTTAVYLNRASHAHAGARACTRTLSHTCSNRQDGQLGLLFVLMPLLDFISRGVNNLLLFPPRPLQTSLPCVMCCFFLSLSACVFVFLNTAVPLGADGQSGGGTTACCSAACWDASGPPAGCDARGLFSQGLAR